jgi:cytochrome P450
VKLSDVDVLNPDLYNGRLPHDQYALLREQAPCHLQRIASPGMIDQAWVVTRYADVRQISRDATDFLNYQGDSLRTSGLAVPEFDFVTDIAVEMPMQVICDLVGVPPEDRPQMLRWSNTIATPLDPDLSPQPRGGGTGIARHLAVRS